jgi:homoserine O-succinyltransferase/O-acetyltransferase
MQMETRSAVDDVALNRSSPAKALRDSTPLVIGIVNNMPDAALAATERQFHDLLVDAAQDRAISLRLFSISELPRSEASRAHINTNYEDIGKLWTNRLDGLIVTGAEPRTPHLADEPYWPTLTKIIDWAEENTISTVWSCLAAHAAVLHTDGIRRRPFREKLSGVFDCAKVADHPLVSDSPSHWCVPHSRYNGLPEEELDARGYRVVSRAPEVGADLFIRQGNSLSIFLQGHPEYQPEALLLEYRRDIRRFIAGKRDRYPEMPRGYFEANLEAEFAELRQRIVSKRSSNPVLKFPEAEGRFAYSWRDHAVRLYSNWLSYLAEQKVS